MLSAFVLKLIACITMLLDHIGAAYLQASMMDMSSFNISLYYMLRIIGRIAFPIFCFFIVEGGIHTKNKYKYMLRLGIFALISQIPFNYFVNGNFYDFSYLNVYFTLLISLSCIIVYEKFKDTKYKYISILYLLFALMIADVINCDYGAGGVLHVLVFYFFRNKYLYLFLSILLIDWLYFSPIQMFSVLSLVLLYFYNGNRGFSNKFVQYGFYLFYPLHIFIIDIILYFA